MALVGAGTRGARQPWPHARTGRGLRRAEAETAKSAPALATGFSLADPAPSHWNAGPAAPSRARLPRPRPPCARVEQGCRHSLPEVLQALRAAPTAGAGPGRSGQKRGLCPTKGVGVAEVR